jgi:hypothetical protein
MSGNIQPSLYLRNSLFLWAWSGTLNYNKCDLFLHDVLCNSAPIYINQKSLCSLHLHSAPFVMSSDGEWTKEKGEALKNLSLSSLSVYDLSADSMDTTHRGYKTFADSAPSRWLRWHWVTDDVRIKEKCNEWDEAVWECKSCTALVVKSRKQFGAGAQISDWIQGGTANQARGRQHGYSHDSNVFIGCK